MSESILSVSVSKPKPNIFMSHIQYILTVATVTDIILLGITIEADSNCLRLSKPLYKVSTDTIHMADIARNEKSHEVFLAGRDGCIYELLYGLNKSWSGYIGSLTGRKQGTCTSSGGFITLTNHTRSTLSKLLFPTLLTGPVDAFTKILYDGERKVLYTLSEKGNISVYTVSSNSATDSNNNYRNSSAANASKKSSEEADKPKTVTLVHTLYGSNITKIIKNSIIQATGPSAVPSKVIEGHMVSFSIIPTKVSKLLALQVISSSGVRLYISLGFKENEIKTLHISHIRLPPGLTPNAEPWKKPNDVMMLANNQDLSLTVAIARDKNVLPSNVASLGLLNGNLTSSASHSTFVGGNQKNNIPNSTLNFHSSNSDQIFNNKSGDVLWLFNRPSSSTLATIITSKERNQSAKDFNIMVNLGRKEAHSSSHLNHTCWVVDETSDGSLVLITPEQIFLINSYKPKDELKLILNEVRNFESPKVENFFVKYFNTGIATAACLELICESEKNENLGNNANHHLNLSNFNKNISLGNLASHAFFRYSKSFNTSNLKKLASSNLNNNIFGLREPEVKSSSDLLNYQNDTIKKFRSLNEKSQDNNGSGHDNNSTGHQNLDLLLNSEKFKGIINFISATLNEIYNIRIFHVTVKKDGESKVSSNLSENALKTVILRLNSLKVFLETHANTSLSESPILNNLESLDEKSLVNGQYHFICLTLELINFWLILIEIPNHLNQIWKRLSIDIQAKFQQNMSIRWLLLQPSDLASGFNLDSLKSDEKTSSGDAPVASNLVSKNNYARNSGAVQTVQPLVHALIKSYLDEGMPVETLCSKLHNQCPQLFTTDDYIAANALVGVGVGENFCLVVETLKIINTKHKENLCA